MGVDRQALVIWAAGFIDGEGNIGIRQSVRTSRGTKTWFHHQLLLKVSQVEVAPLLRLKELWGGFLWFNPRSTKNPNWADQYEWQIRNEGAVRACREIMPYLTVKAPQAMVAVQYGTTIKKRAGRNGMPIADVELRKALREEILRLNVRGPSRLVQETPKLIGVEAPQLRLLEVG